MSTNPVTDAGSARLFWAFRPPDDVVREAADLLRGLQAPCQKLGYQVTWVRASSMHTTLKFLGDVPAARVPELVARAQRGMAMQPMAPAIVRLRGLGAFPQADKPKVLWIGVQGESGSNQARLGAIATAVEDWMVELGFPREERPYRAHLTLGRVRDRRMPRGAAAPAGRDATLSADAWRRGLSDLFGSYADRAVGSAFALKEIILYESRLGSDAPEYVPLATLPVHGGK